MSTEPSRQPKGTPAGGEFAAKEHDAVDGDLGVSDPDEVIVGVAPRVPSKRVAIIGGRFSMGTAQLIAALGVEDAHLDEHPLFAVIDMTEYEAREQMDNNIARWMASLHVTAEAIEDDHYEVEVCYVDPIDSEMEVVSDGAWRSDLGDDQDMNIDLDAACPFNDDGKLREGVELPPQFTDAGRAEMQSYVEAGFTRTEADQWKVAGFTAGEAVAWREVSNDPSVAAHLRRDNGGLEAAHAYVEYDRISAVGERLAQEIRRDRKIIDRLNERIRAEQSIADRADLAREGEALRLKVVDAIAASQKNADRLFDARSKWSQAQRDYRNSTRGTN